MVVRDEAVFDQADVERIREQLRQVPPEVDGFPSARWTVRRLLLVLDWLPPRTESGLWRLLRRHRFRLRSGRPRQFSPDPAYAEKEAALLDVLHEVAAVPTRRVVLFVDVMAYHHWPEPGPDWSSLADPPPQANRAPPGERHKKVIGALDACTGRVLSHHRARMTGEQIADFWEQIAAAYPDVETIHVVLDNAPVHHCDVVTTAAAQHGITLVFLPTYSPWLNPIEKLWAWLRDAVLRMHRLAGQWDQVPQAVQDFLALFADGSEVLLRRVGLLGEGKLATALRTPA